MPDLLFRVVALRPLRSPIFFGVSAFLLLWTTLAVQAREPFVAGFDRFAPHGEIEANLAGRLLLTELNCTACHPANSGTGDWKPKLGPHLDAVGSRLQPDWVTQFLQAPQHLQAGSTMPAMLDHFAPTERTQAAQAITAFLMDQRQPFPEIKATGLHPVPARFWDKGNVDRGRKLYHQVGCVACHDSDDDYEVAEMKPSPLDQLLEQLDPEDIADMGLSSAARRVQSVPHSTLTEKYTIKSLTFFLLNPAAVRPGGRMPSLKLDAVDSAHIATWLMSRETPQAAAPSAEQGSADTDALIAQGRGLFEKLRCGQCHQLKSVNTNKLAKPLTALDLKKEHSCLRPAEHRTPDSPLPQYTLDQQQTRALQSVLNSSSVQALTSAEKLQLTLLQLNCYACHERDGLGGVGRFRKAYFETVGHVDIGDEGRLPPQLTNVGRKLKTEWLDDVLNKDATVRPHLQIRMPQFSRHSIDNLPEQFEQVDHPQSHPGERQVFGAIDNNANVVENGRILMDVGCVQCHAFKGETLPGSVGVDLANVAQRLHPQWFHDFLVNPESLKSRTRMPTFFPNGQSQAKQIQDGDMHRQIAAMWAYVKDLNNQPLPYQIQAVRNHNFELTPQERAIVIRTFMPVAGTHAIAVGLPGGVHAAFDAQNVQFAQAWRGRFLDAEGTWFSRFTPPAEPLGENVIVLPSGPPFAMESDSSSSWPNSAAAASIVFGGYRLGDKGVPTFLYRLGKYHFEDTVTATDEKQLLRTIRVQRTGEHDTAALRFLAHAGRSLNRVNARSVTSDSGLTITVDRAVEEVLPDFTGQIQAVDHVSRWMLPVPVADTTLLKVTYTW